MPFATFFQWLLLFHVLLLPLFLITKVMNKRSRRNYLLPPGPSQLPIIGNLRHLLTDLPHRSLLSLSRKYGSLMYLKLGGVPTIVISSARMASEVMKSQDHKFCTRPTLVAQKMLSYNSMDVAFSPYGPSWREMRKICILELFTLKKVQSFDFIRDEEVSSMINSIAASSSSSSSSCSNAVNLSEMLVTLSNNVVCRSAFGRSYFKGGDGQSWKIHEVIDELGVLLGSFCVTDFLPWMWWVDGLKGLWGRLRRNFIKLDHFYEKVIEEHLDPKRDKHEHEDLVDVLLRAEEDLRLTRDQLKGILMNIILGGSDSSAAVMVWVMAELMRNPIAMKKVQEEVRGVVGRKGKVEERDLHQLQYLHSVVKETLRLHPPTPFLVRETMEHCKIDGYDIIPKTRVIINTLAIGQNPESWDNPEDFSPERFMNSSVDYKGQYLELVPFGAGRRGCPGINFAVPTVELALANLLYSFDWEVFSTGMDMKEAFGLVVHPRTPLRLVPKKFESGCKL